MAGTVIITGANGSLALHAVQCLLSSWPDRTAILTVRDASKDDPNTAKLRNIISAFPKAKVSIQALDLANLSAVHAFATTIQRQVSSGDIAPLESIICNAYYWNLKGPAATTDDGYEMTYQVNHLAQAALVLRLLGSFGPSGRVVLFTGDSQFPGQNGLEKLPPGIPEDLDDLLKAKEGTDYAGLGFQRYANSKLVITTWTHILNDKLEKDENLNHITAVVMNPGNLVDSRAMLRNTPPWMPWLQRLVLRPFRPILRLNDATLRSSADAGKDAMELAMSAKHAGERGFFTLLEKDESPPESRDRAKQEKIWTHTLKWSKVRAEDVGLTATGS